MKSRLSMEHRFPHRNRLLGTRVARGVRPPKRRNLWAAAENEPVVATGITSIFEQNPATKIRNLLHYWVQIKATGKMPNREIVSVFQVSGLLPYVWMIDVVRTPKIRFRFGLIKTHIQRAAGSDPEALSRFVDEVDPKKDTAMLCDYFRRVVVEERPLYRRGRPILPWRANFQMQQSLYLPLANKGPQVDAILAISLFRDSAGRWH
jgi:hypothetical protein